MSPGHPAARPLRFVQYVKGPFLTLVVARVYFLPLYPSTPYTPYRPCICLVAENGSNGLAPGFLPGRMLPKRLTLGIQEGIAFPLTGTIVQTSEAVGKWTARPWCGSAGDPGGGLLGFDGLNDPGAR